MTGKSHKSQQGHKKQKTKNRNLTLALLAGVLFMFGFCYMLVPLYRLVCKQQGINGQSVRTAAIVDAGMQIDATRTITVHFTTVLHHDLAFRFYPLQHSVDIHPGEQKLIYFYAENKTGGPLTVQAIPSITPVDAARYLKKTECFCFTQQYFYQNERADMPVYFFVDPDIPKNIQEITLAYTLFDASGFEKKETHFRKGRIDL